MAEYNAIYHKGKTILTTVGLPSHEVNVMELAFSPFNKEGYIPAGYEHRPDLIADLFFNNASSWSIIMEMNGIFDPFESLKVGDRINIPND
jgi:hypothetical protein